METRNIHSFSSGNRLKTLLIPAIFITLFLIFRNSLADIFLLIFGACVISFLLSPACAILEKYIPESIAAIIVLVACFSLLSAAVFFLVPFVLRQIAEAADKLPNALERIQEVAESFLRRIHDYIPGIRQLVPDFGYQNTNFPETINKLLEYAGSFAGKMYKLALMIVLSYFLLCDRKNILLRAELLVPAAWRKTAIRTGNVLLRELRMYLRGQATIALCVGGLAGIGLTAAGIPSGVFWGLVVGIFNVIPYFGPVIGGIPAVLLSLSISWKRALITVGLLFLVQQIDGMVISPRVMGNITGFSPATVLLALFIGSKTGGIGGMLLAVPALMTVRTLYRVFVQRYEND